MSLTEIKEATEKLTPTEREELARWLREPQQPTDTDDPDGEVWNKQFADDVEAGRLDYLIAGIEANHKAGRTRPL